MPGVQLPLTVDSREEAARPLWNLQARKGINPVKLFSWTNFHAINFWLKTLYDFTVNKRNCHLTHGRLLGE